MFFARMLVTQCVYSTTRLCAFVVVDIRPVDGIVMHKLQCS